jgi:hypothetical protein
VNPNDPKLEMTRDQTIRNPTRSKPERPKIRDDSRLDNPKSDSTRAAYMYLIILKLYHTNIKLLFINSTYTRLPVYFEGVRLNMSLEGDHVKHGFHK